jgi:ABC-type transport system involved in multi-copper enzyme maturation permease subunit
MKKLLIKEWKEQSPGNIYIISILFISSIFFNYFAFKFSPFSNSIEYYKFVYNSSFYSLIPISIITIYYYSNLISNEIDHNTSNFLFSKPISREKILITKSIFGMFILFCVVLLPSLSIILFSFLFKQEIPYYLIVIFGLHNFLFLISLGSFVLFISTFDYNSGNIITQETSNTRFISILLILFVFSLKLNPLKILYTINIIYTHQIEWFSIILCLVLIFIFHTLSLYAIKKKSF